ncbi:MAG: hypothetical protein HYU47_12595 [Deltaproteobacteria bacterium]|nr:hypothetical protein [Deltaproteobacteria bacterium]MBI3061712.1 hypothetical protein [Deltaproteobacteria bacterium]
MKKLAVVLAIVMGIGFISSITSTISKLSYAQESPEPEPKPEKPDPGKM